MPVSPDVRNYYIGKGKVFFTPAGGVERMLGNAPKFEVVPKMDMKDHYSSMGATRAKDFQAVDTIEVTASMTLEEVTQENLGLAFFGEPEANSAGQSEVRIMSLSKVTGSIRFQGTNAIGSTKDVHLTRVNFTPNGGFPFIGDDWGQIELTCEALIVAGDFGSIVETAEEAT